MNNTTQITLLTSVQLACFMVVLFYLKHFFLSLIECHGQDEFLPITCNPYHNCNHRNASHFEVEFMPHLLVREGSLPYSLALLLLFLFDQILLTDKRMHSSFTKD